jgi:hypothetical protein
MFTFELPAASKFTNLTYVELACLRDPWSTSKIIRMWLVTPQFLLGTCHSFGEKKKIGCPWS